MIDVLLRLALLAVIAAALPVLRVIIAEALAALSEAVDGGAR